MPATLTRLKEDTYSAAAPGRVDRDRGVIKGVKIAGTRSINRGAKDGDRYAGRVYPLEVLRKAAPLYEGKPVYADHPDDPDERRHPQEKLGKVVNVRPGADGLYADLVVNRSHPLAESLFEAASDPLRHDFFGFSHNADGDTEVRDGALWVREIVEVYSVDLVSKPATTTGLFESADRRPAHYRTKTRGRAAMPARMKLHEHFDRIKLLPPARRVVTRLFEMGYMDPDMPMQERMYEDDPPPPEMADEPASAAPMSADPAEMDPKEALRAGFSAAWNAVFGDTTLDQKAKIDRAKKLIAAYEELTGSGESIPENHEDEGAPGSEREVGAGDSDGESVVEGCAEDGMAKGHDPLKFGVKESAELRQLRTEKAARRLCEAAGYAPSDADLDILASLKNDEQRKATIERFKRPAAAGKDSPERPARKAQSAPSWLPEAAARQAQPASPNGVTDAETFARALLHGIN